MKKKPKAKPKKKPAPKKKSPAKKKPTKKANWPGFVKKHGVVLASARGPVPSIAEAVAGEPIVGSWWSHKKAHAIFDALCAIDDAPEHVKCFRLVDKKITFVHRRLWPALARLADAGVLPAERVAAIHQEHMPSGEHRNFTVPFPAWVPADELEASAELSIEQARAQLGGVV